MPVSRTEAGILKEPATERELALLQALAGSGHAPAVLDHGPSWILLEDLGMSEPIRDAARFRRNCIRLLWALRQRRIRHGDLTAKNVIVRSDRPVAVDFEDSSYFGERPRKRTTSDSYVLWRWVFGMTSALDPTSDSTRSIRRWLAVSAAFGGVVGERNLAGRTLLDLGCFRGEFCSMAAADGMFATGVDRDGASICVARASWADMLAACSGDEPGCCFHENDIMGWGDFRYDAVLLLSSWAYIVRDHGREAAFGLLDRMTRECGALFFETQLVGDGPGPAFLVTDDDVANMLGQFGTPRPLATFPVPGRAAERTVWEVTR